MFSIIRNWNSRENRLKAALRIGRPSGILRASWIADLAALGKVITLCGLCRTKWNAKKNGYERRDAVPSRREVVGECDGCNGRSVPCETYFPIKEKH